MGQRSVYTVVVRKHERSLRKPWRSLEDNIKMDLQEVGRGRGVFYDSG